MGPQLEGVAHLVCCKTEKDDCNEDYAASNGNVESSTGGGTERRVLCRIGRTAWNEMTQEELDRVLDKHIVNKY